MDIADFFPHHTVVVSCGCWLVQLHMSVTTHAQTRFVHDKIGYDKRCRTNFERPLSMTPH